MDSDLESEVERHIFPDREVKLIPLFRIKNFLVSRRYRIRAVLCVL